MSSPLALGLLILMWLMALFLEVNMALMLFMVMVFLLHEATALWDVPL